MKVNELRELLKDLPGDMPVGVAYPDEKHADQCHETVDVRTARVTDPFHKFAGVTKEIFVLERTFGLAVLIVGLSGTS